MKYDSSPPQNRKTARVNGPVDYALGLGKFRVFRGSKFKNAHDDGSNPSSPTNFILLQCLYRIW